jgi:FdhD protein
MDYETVKIVEVADSKEEAVDGNVVLEEPMQIIADGVEVATIMRTPGNDKELAVGFMFSEGLIKHINDVQMISAKSDDNVDSSNTVNLKLKSGVKFTAAQRAYEVRSSCGICGQKKIDDLFNDTNGVKIIQSSFKVKYNNIFKMPDIMADAQRLSKITRGAHAAAFFTKDADMTACFEDVGRHNALDKLIGHCLINSIKMGDKVLLLSGRSSYEMLAKSIRCGVEFVASISAPSSLAVEIAKRGNIALAGLVRSNTMKIYNRDGDFIT